MSLFFSSIFQDKILIRWFRQSALTRQSGAFKLRPLIPRLAQLIPQMTISEIINKNSNEAKSAVIEVFLCGQAIEFVNTRLWIVCQLTTIIHKAWRVLKLRPTLSHSWESSLMNVINSNVESKDVWNSSTKAGTLGSSTSFSFVSRRNHTFLWHTFFKITRFDLSVFDYWNVLIMADFN